MDWQPDPELLEEFGATLAEHSERNSLLESLTLHRWLDLYRGMLRMRLHDIMLKRWVRQGVISKAWLGTGEEATTIGPVHALERDTDVVAPMIRNAGACCEMGVSIADMLRGYLGTYDSPSKGRDGHVGSFSHRVLQPISTIGDIPPVVAGIGLYFKMQKKPGVALTWIGDGATKTGPVHEAFNFAAVQRLPVIFVLQNNQIALGTRTSASHLTGTFEDLHEAYGVAGWSFDGNNVLDAFAATRLAAARCRAGRGPVFLSADTFRMGGHATHDEREARLVIPQSEFVYWGKRDPIGMFEGYLMENGVTQQRLEHIEEEIIREVDGEAARALASREEEEPAPASALQDVYAQEASSPQPTGS